MLGREDNDIVPMSEWWALDPFVLIQPRQEKDEHDMYVNAYARTIHLLNRLNFSHSFKMTVSPVNHLFANF